MRETDVLERRRLEVQETVGQSVVARGPWLWLCQLNEYGMRMMADDGRGLGDMCANARGVVKRFRPCPFGASRCYPPQPITLHCMSSRVCGYRHRLYGNLFSSLQLLWRV